MFCSTLCVPQGMSNNIQVTNGALTGGNGTQVFVQFDVTWENGWRINPDRWDAAWVFIKYRTANGLWQHARLEGTGHTAPPNSTLSVGLVDPSTPFNLTTNPCVGVFIHRSAEGNGTMIADDIQLLWNHTADGVGMGDVLEVRVFAIEMVYVPQGAFYVASGGTEAGSFTDGAWTTGPTIPLTITSEAAITIGQAAGNLWGTSSSGNSTIGPAGTLDAAFPKGYNAFYCMKYEISQQGYVDFLNTLTYAQQAARTSSSPNSAQGTGALSTTNDNRNGIDIQTPGVASAIPAVYACNLDGDGVFGEAVDGKDIACNFISGMDLAAYLDWSGLRPMTELEFEKACRGILPPVPNEFPWGSNQIAPFFPYGLDNSGTENEQISSFYATIKGNAAYDETSNVLNGPFRVGIFSANINNTGRMTSGAGYYGTMELGGNNEERVVTVGTMNGRSFSGANGNGTLSATGDPDVSTWPSDYSARGGSCGSIFSVLRTSNRISASIEITGRSPYGGGRGVRVAQ